MRKLTQMLTSFAATATLHSSGAQGAPGDEIARWTLPAPCSTSPAGLAFDGTTLYYNLRSAPNNDVHLLDARTGAYKGIIAVLRNGNPAPNSECCSGLEFDANRCALWASGGPFIRSVDPATGEIVFDLDATNQIVATAVGYDFIGDRVWCGDSSKQNIGYCPDPPAGNICKTEVVYSVDRGLTADGVDLWHFTNNVPSSTWSGGTGVLFPSNMLSSFDLSRALDIPGAFYVDIAFDCTTFPVPVVWAGSSISCEVIAFEVDSRAACPPPPPVSVLRISLWSMAERTARLPFDRKLADRAWSMAGMTSFRDEGVLDDPTRPLIYWQLGGACGSDIGNVLRMTKDPSLPAVLLYKAP